jgi:RNA polymerase sigma-70 factor (ECF subfamily)
VLSVHGSISDVTDEELVLLARSGDRKAFGELVQRYEVVVYRAALAALRVPEDAEEASQDAFVRAWRSLPHFRGEASFRTWLLTITWNRCLVRRRSIARWFGRRAPLEAASSVAVGDRRADDAVCEEQMRSQVAREIARLTPKLRDALVLASSGEFGYDEIAGMLKIPTGTVKWRVSEAKRKVRRRLVELGYVDAR